MPWKGQLRELSEPDQVREALEMKLASIRKAMASQRLSIQCTAVEEKRFTLELQCDDSFRVDSSVSVKCWPSSLRAEDGRAPEYHSGSLAAFGPLSAEAITSFFAFELEAAESGVTVASRFVLSLPLQGAPADRLEKLLASQLKDKEHVLRFLWLLLESELSASDAEELTASMLEGSTSRQGTLEGCPIFERIVSSLGNSVDRARDVGRVIEDLLRSPEGRAVLPEGLAELWAELKFVIEESNVQSA